MLPKATLEATTIGIILGRVGLSRGTGIAAHLAQDVRVAEQAVSDTEKLQAFRARATVPTGGQGKYVGKLTGQQITVQGW